MDFFVFCAEKLEFSFARGTVMRTLFFVRTKI